MKELDDLIASGYTLRDLKRLRDKVKRRKSDDREENLAEIDALIKITPDPEADQRKRQKEIQKKNVAYLVKQLRGDRTVRRLAEDSGVAASYIVGLEKGDKYIPSPEIIKKLTRSEAKPQNGIMQEDLMIAAGYLSDYVFKNSQESIVDYVYEKDTNISTSSRLMTYTAELTTENQEQERVERIKAQRLEQDKFCAISTAIIYKALAEKGIIVANVVGADMIRGFKPDLTVKLSDKSIKNWWFCIPLARPDSAHNTYRGWARHLLMNFIFIQPDADRKISIVTDKENAYDELAEYRDKLSYRGDLSVILIDAEKITVVKEIYLSHYRDNNNISELYIV